jgi:dihydropyrimidinase
MDIASALFITLPQIVASISVDHSGMWDADFDSAARFTLSPPLRPRSHVNALARGLAGGALQLVGTDHAAFNTSQKRLGRTDFREIPLSGNGIEERLHVTWDVLVNAGLASPSDFVRVTSTEAARIFNLYPRKGVLAPGSDADVIVFDPDEVHTLSAQSAHGAIDTSLWEGRTVRGRVTHTVSRGRLLWADGVLDVPRGTGRFVPAAPFGSLYSGASAEQMLAAQRATDFPADTLGAWPVKRPEGATSGGREEL